MEKVVYLLGAGFSAPLGLPVMSNFLEKSKDQYFDKPEQYSYFEGVFTTIRNMAVAKNYYRTDLFNIEDILSILEMQQSVGGVNTKKDFERYIIEVVKYHTKKITAPEPGEPFGWQHYLFGHQPFAPYGAFVAALLGLSIRVDDPNRPTRFIEVSQPSRIPDYNFAPPERRVSYSLITLNYDLVLENTARFIIQRLETHYQSQKPLPCINRAVDDSTPSDDVPLAKLHGSVDSGKIIAPTWNKGLTHDGVLPEWEGAFRLLERANYIRIIGYSLPITDAYVKFLLRAAVIDAKHLKRIDVLCLDDSRGSVQKRYDEFVEFSNYRFVSARTEEYLDRHFNLHVKNPTPENPYVHFGGLEKAHDDFFDVYRRRAGML